MLWGGSVAMSLPCSVVAGQFASAKEEIESWNELGTS